MWLDEPYFSDESSQFENTIDEIRKVYDAHSEDRDIAMAHKKKHSRRKHKTATNKVEPLGKDRAGLSHINISVNINTMLMVLLFISMLVQIFICIQIGKLSCSVSSVKKVKLSDDSE